MRKLQASLLTVGALLLTAAAFAQRPGGDPLSGTWVGDWGPSPSDRNQVTVELKWDGTALSGTVNPGPNAVPLQKASLDPKTSTVHFEAQATGRRGQELHYKVDGTLARTVQVATNALGSGRISARRRRHKAFAHALARPTVVSIVVSTLGALWCPSVALFSLQVPVGLRR